MIYKISKFISDYLEILADFIDKIIDNSERITEYIKILFNYLFGLICIIYIYIASDSILITTGVVLLLWYLGRKFNFMIVYTRADAIGISKKLFYSLNEIYNDDLLVRDMVTIIRSQGDINNIVINARSNVYKEHHPTDLTHRCSGCDYQDYFSNPIDKDILIITNRILASNGFKSFSKRHELTEEDDQNIFRVFYYIISRPDFAITARQYLFPYVDNNIKISKRSISRKDFRG
jgi:hypothetical protein